MNKAEYSCASESLRYLSWEQANQAHFLYGMTCYMVDALKYEKGEVIKRIFSLDYSVLTAPEEFSINFFDKAHNQYSYNGFSFIFKSEGEPLKPIKFTSCVSTSYYNDLEGKYLRRLGFSSTNPVDEVRCFYCEVEVNPRPVNSNFAYKMVTEIIPFDSQAYNPVLSEIASNLRSI